ncbi:4-alpha-glucanotransferase [Kineobactrum salinum]|uniref:4-alpha-glucanotransferase n=1 Tax=Kineobactrum salinum TaxID=2708301 RepID=A0A6C0TZW7_9GAMM|nr:4-alpha-glucanotransferase [Kineobactrum salinum]QIB65198.1 4-alpha-glucanotransferase [Kineobactrum salinum]
MQLDRERDAVMDELEKLLYLTGVSSQYLDYGGERREVPAAHRLQALRVMGYVPDDPAAVRAAVAELDEAHWRQWLDPCYVVAAARPGLQLHCHPRELAECLQWQLSTAEQEVARGEWRPGVEPEVGDYHSDGVRYSARELVLPALQPGYYTLRMWHRERTESSQVMACPERCFDAADPDQRLWGVSCQLYTLRSGRNWGIGDFTDLRQLLDLAAGAGADLVGLNPLHAPCSDSPDAASPYSPSDRRFINPLYIDPEQLPEWAAVATGEAVGHWQESCRQLRSEALVDHERVAQLKYAAFEALFDQFVSMQAATARGRRFAEFEAAGGASLSGFADYEADHNPFADRHRQDPRFHSWLQWLAITQLTACQQHARSIGMRVGLMRDLAVGSVVRGCEVQQTPGLYLPGATIGAPPDPFAHAGQDWGMPVLHPQRLRQQCYRQFIELLQCNMLASGALRMDHVMSLLRLWWCLPATETGAAAGLYVYYPLQELLALLRLESWRNQCAVVGEDLGVVPAELRLRMHESGVYGNRVLYFEQHHDRRFKAPAEHQDEVLLMVSNHDVPALADWWQGSDLQRRQQLGLVADEAALAGLLQERITDKRRLLEALAAEALLPASWSGAAPDRVFDMALCSAIHRFCARSRSRLLLLQLEDLQLMREPVNIPGTYREYPNWRRKQALDTDAIFAAPAVRQLLAAVNQERMT